MNSYYRFLLKNSAKLVLLALLFPLGSNAQTTPLQLKAECTTTATDTTGTRHDCYSAWQTYQAPQGYIILPSQVKAADITANGDVHRCDIVYGNKIEISPGVFYPTFIKLQAYALSPSGPAAGRGWQTCQIDSVASTYVSQKYSSNNPYISMGPYGAFGIKTDGSLWGRGANNLGQLGDGTTTNTDNMKQIDTGYAAIAVGTVHTVGLKSDGSLWIWGNNSYGEFGDGTTTNSKIPKKIGTGYIAIAAGEHVTYALKADGSLWSWGSYGSNQLGVNSGLSNALNPVQIGADYAAISYRAEQLSNYVHILALKVDGSLWGWGSNAWGQLGDGTKGSLIKSNSIVLPKKLGDDFTRVVTGGYHTMAFKTDGSLWGWGQNDVGQLGDGTTQESLIPKQIATGYTDVAVGGNHTVALKSDGSMYAWGAYGDSTPPRPSLPNDCVIKSSSVPTLIGSGYTNIVANSWDTFAVKSDGNLWEFGNVQGPGFTSKCPQQIDTGYGNSTFKTFTSNAARAITGLYVTYFNRAPDKSGLTYWRDQAFANGESAALYAISSAFAQNAVAKTNYPDTLSTADFVKKMYSYALGRLADAGGQAYWEGRVAAVGRANAMVEFISAVLSYDGAQDTVSSPADKQAALDAQLLINNKISAGVFFATDPLGPNDKSNVPLDSTGNPDINSAVYLASQEVLSAIAKDPATLEAAITKAKNYKASLP